MNKSEMKETNGGILPLLYGLGIAFGTVIMYQWDDVKRGFRAGMAN